MVLRGKISEFLKDRTNQIFLMIFVLAIAIKIYYFIITLNQALWWDEAEYLTTSKYFMGDALIALSAARPLLMSIIWSIFVNLSYGEILIKMTGVLFSLVGILFLYLLVKKVYNGKIALIASALWSFFYLHLFYSQRILIDTIIPTFWLISIYFFYNRLYFG